MPSSPVSMKNPGLFLACCLCVLWLLSWGLLPAATSGAVIAGVSVLTWGQIVLGILALAAGTAAIFVLEKQEARAGDNASGSASSQE